MTTAFEDSDPLDALDGPACFVEAGEAFMDWCPNPLTVASVAETLSRIARAGLIVSVDLYDEVCDGYAAHVQDLERRLYDPEGGEA